LGYKTKSKKVKDVGTYFSNKKDYEAAGLYPPVSKIPTTYTSPTTRTTAFAVVFLWGFGRK
jgi:hypothetical protein